MDAWKIAFYRKMMEMSQKDFAIEIGVNQSTLSKLESGALKMGNLHDKIQGIFDHWRSDRIMELKNQIKNLESL